MVDVLQLAAGKLVTASDPIDWVYLTTGKIVETDVGLQSNSLQISSGRRIGVTGPAAAPTITASGDCMDYLICTQSGTPGCDTISGCSTAGEAHRVEWDTTNCSDGSHHIHVEYKQGTGGWTNAEDDLSCTASDNDSGCCDAGGACTPEGTRVYFMAQTAVLGTTEDWEWRVSIERDSDSFVYDYATDSCTDCGGDETCLT